MKRLQALVALAAVLLLAGCAGMGGGGFVLDDWAALPNVKTINVVAVCYGEKSQSLAFPDQEMKKTAVNFAKGVGEGLTKAGYKVQNDFPPVGEACRIENIRWDPKVLAVLVQVIRKDSLFGSAIFAQYLFRLPDNFRLPEARFLGAIALFKDPGREMEAAEKASAFILDRISKAKEQKSPL